jgi:hypothetical protein
MLDPRAPRKAFNKARSTHNAGQQSTREKFNMRIRRAECLLLVAIVTSAVVAEIRVNTSSFTQANESTQAAQHTDRMQACDKPHDGLLRAACETRSERRPIDSDDRPTNAVDTPHAQKLWV